MSKVPPKSHRNKSARRTTSRTTSEKEPGTAAMKASGLVHTLDELVALIQAAKDRVPRGARDLALRTLISMSEDRARAALAVARSLFDVVEAG